MLRKVKVECPHCHMVSQLHLGTEAPVIVVRCPSCSTSLLVSNGQMVVLSDDEMEAMRGEDGNEILQRILSEHGLPGGQERCDAPVSPKRETADQQDDDSVEDPPAPSVREIGYDDVLDVYTELEHCADSREFIEHLR